MPPGAKTSSTGPARTPAGKKSGATSGWAAVSAKQKEREDRENRPDSLYRFFLKSRESAIVQFLDEEPYTFDAHSVKNAAGKWDTLVCQLHSQKYCLMCRDGIKPGWKAAFKVLDFRGKWDKDKSKFMGGEPVEKLWIVNLTILGLLQNKIEKKGKPLTSFVFDITRTGSGKKDTTYSFDEAYDADDNKIKPMEWDSETPPTSELLKPLSDEQLISVGFEKPEEDGD